LKTWPPPALAEGSPSDHLARRAPRLRRGDKDRLDSDSQAVLAFSLVAPGFFMLSSRFRLTAACTLRDRVGLALVVALALTLGAIGDSHAQQVGAESSAPVQAGLFAGDLRALPTVAASAPGSPVREAPLRRQVRPPSVAGSAALTGGRDALLDRQAAVSAQRGTQRAFSPPTLNFDGQGNTGVVPPDAVGDVGVNYYVQITNGAVGSPVTIYDKATGAVVAGPFVLESLWTGGGACGVGNGDPIVLYDALAGRWMLSEFASAGNHLCVSVSQTNDPVGGGWYNYDFTLPQFPDYPKYAVWPDAYYVSSNESSPAAYALDRTSMLSGLPATFQRMTASPLGGFGFQSLTPSDVDGSTLPPAGSPNFFMRHRDDEVHNPGLNDPLQDFLEIWEYHVDFSTPANTTFSLAATIPVSEFESELCGLSSFECFPQPGTTQLLDPLREVVMWRLQYRNLGTHQTLVGTFVSDVDGGSADHGGLRWFELRRTGTGPWSLFQEGTWAPDADHRWLGSIAMDGSGNLALGYSISSNSTFPGIRYVGRLDGDTAGAMTTAEQTIIDGSASQTGTGRWGDYSSMSVDPVDDCTFWYTNEYIPASGSWATRIARFRFPSPDCSDAAPPVCGNNLRELAEQCDGSDDAACPGLCLGDCSCPPPLCGNNILESGEQCDGSADAACPGLCQGDCTCPAPGCASSPEPLCLSAAVAKLDYNEDKPGKEKVKLQWKRVASPTSQGDFGNPVSGSTSVELCIYDDSGTLVQGFFVDRAMQFCGNQLCWKTKSSKGYLYKDKGTTTDGIKKLGFTSGAAGKGKADSIGKNNAGKGQTALPTGVASALSGNTAATIQMITSDGLCVGATMNEVKIDDGFRYTARRK